MEERQEEPHQKLEAPEISHVRGRRWREEHLGLGHEGEVGGHGGGWGEERVVTWVVLPLFLHHQLGSGPPWPRT